MMRLGTVGFPFLNGVYIALDAIPDAMLVVDGPYCVVNNTGTQRGHHLASDLASPFKNGRVIPTQREAALEEVASMALDRDHILRKALAGTARANHPGILLATSFDFVELVQRPLTKIVDSLRAEGLSIAALAGSSLSDHWLDGYRCVLETLAQHLHLPQRQRVGKSVGIVGYFFDRDEGDHQGNLAEIRRLLSALGWSLGPVWLSGHPVRELAEIASCDAILSFRYGGKAAATLGQRLNVPVVDVDLPLGLGGTAQFLRQVGEALGCTEQAERIIAQEAESVLERCAHQVAQFLAGASASIVLDPYLAPATAALCQELGIQVAYLAEVRHSVVFLPLPSSALSGMPPPAPLSQTATFNRHFWISSSMHQNPGPDCIRIHFGYPDFVHHPLAPRPFFGFQGLLWWVETLSSCALASEIANLLPG